MRVVCLNQDSGIQPHRKKGAAVHLKEMRRSFKALGADVVPIDVGDPKEAHQALEAAWKEKPFDCIYERYALGAEIGSELARARRIPHVLEVNTPLIQEETRWRGPVAPEVQDLEHRVFKNAKFIVCVSKEVADYVRAHDIEEERVGVFPNGVDHRRFRPRDKDDSLRAELIPEGRFVLGFHGRLRGWHGFERLVDSTCRMLAQGLPLHLLLVGEGDFEKVLEGKVDPDRYTRAPWVDHDEVPRYVACLDGLGLTYPPDAPCYFSPLKLAEAMASGVVPIVPDIGDLTKVVHHEENGLVFAADDLSGFERCVRLLVENEDQRRLLARGAVESAAAMSWDRIAQRVLETLEERVR